MGTRLAWAAALALALLGEAFAQTPTPTAIREEWVTTYRLQQACSSTGAIAPGALAQVCVTWGMPNLAHGLSATPTQYEPHCIVRDSASSTAAALKLHHVVSGHSSTQACAVVHNQDATSARSGTLCCRGYRWGLTE